MATTQSARVPRPSPQVAPGLPAGIERLCPRDVHWPCQDSASRHNRDGSSDFTHAGAVLRQLEIAKISEPRDSTPSSSAVNTTEMESRRLSLSRVIVLRGRLVAIEEVRKRRRQAVQAILQIGSFLDERCGYLRV